MKPIQVFAVLNTCNLVCNFALSVIGPFFPDFAKEKGISEFTVGLIFAAHPVGDVIAALIIGKTLTPQNSRWLMSLGILISGLGLFVFASLHLTNDKDLIIRFSVIARLIGGFGASMFLTPFYASIQIMFPESVEGKMAFAEFASGLGYLVGPMFGSILYSIGGYILPFIFFGSVSVILSIILPIVLEYQDQQTKTTEPKSFQEMELNVLSLSSLDQPVKQSQDKQSQLPLIDKQSIQQQDEPEPEMDQQTERKLGYIESCHHYDVMVTLIVCFSCNELFTFYPPLYTNYFKEAFNITPDYVGYIQTASSIGYTISSFMVGFIKNNKSLWIFGGLIMTGLPQYFYGPDKLFNMEPNLTHTIFSLFWCGFFVSFPFILSLPYLSEKLLNHFPNNTQSCYNISSGMFKASMALGGLVSPIISGALVTEYRFPRTAALNATYFLLISLLFIPILVSERIRNKIQIQQ